MLKESSVSGKQTHEQRRQQKHDLNTNSTKKKKNFQWPQTWSFHESEYEITECVCLDKKTAVSIKGQDNKMEWHCQW